MVDPGECPQETGGAGVCKSQMTSLNPMKPNTTNSVSAKRMALSHPGEPPTHTVLDATLSVSCRCLHP